MQIQFHPHFKSSFCANILSPKKYKPKLHKKSARETFFYKKALSKMLVTLTPDSHAFNILIIFICRSSPTSNDKVQTYFCCLQVYKLSL